MFSNISDVSTSKMAEKISVSQLWNKYMTLRPDHQATNNLTQQQRETLKQLRERTDIVIKKADKSGQAIAWKTHDNISEAERHLMSSTYTSCLGTYLNSTTEKVRQHLLKYVALNVLTIRRADEMSILNPKWESLRCGMMPSLPIATHCIAYLTERLRFPTRFSGNVGSLKKWEAGEDLAITDVFEFQPKYNAKKCINVGKYVYNTRDNSSNKQPKLIHDEITNKSHEHFDVIENQIGMLPMYSNHEYTVENNASKNYRQKYVNKRNNSRSVSLENLSDQEDSKRFRRARAAHKYKIMEDIGLPISDLKDYLF
ncbi:hypothetical protein GJ496_006390 [Pomphorhynchus laevis]|nr:hypothetical protein GJ496_006390 [Pomphorhynchus laevis]